MALPPTGYRRTAPSVAMPIGQRPPLPEDRDDRGRMPYPLGVWRDGKFVFASPEAARQWDADSFMQGSHHQNWMKGRPLDTDENTLAGMGLPPSDDVYRGPDGQHYRPTPASREDPHLAALRAAHLAEEPVQGSAFDIGKRASEKAMPKALQWMATSDRALVANDNRAAANKNDSALLSAGMKSPHSPSDVTTSPQQVANVDSARSDAISLVERENDSDSGKQSSLDSIGDRYKPPFLSMSPGAKSSPGRGFETAGIMIPSGSFPEQPIIQLWDWLTREGQGEGCPAPNCDEVYKQCNEVCTNTYVEDPDQLPGVGHDMKGRIRRCVRECMEAHGCYSY